MLPPPKQPLGSLHPACNHCDLWHVWSYLSRDSASMSKLLHELDSPDIPRWRFHEQKNDGCSDMFQRWWQTLNNNNNNNHNHNHNHNNNNNHNHNDDNDNDNANANSSNNDNDNDNRNNNTWSIWFLMFFQECQWPKNKTIRWTRKQCLISNPSDCKSPNGPPCHTRQLKDFDQIRTRCLGLLYHWTRISYRWFRTHEENRTSQTLRFLRFFEVESRLTYRKRKRLHLPYTSISMANDDMKEFSFLLILP